MSLGRRIAKEITFYIFIIFITLLIGEAGLRVYNFFVPSFIFYNNSYNRYRGQPNADFFGFKLNSKGFKDKEFTVSDNNYKIVGLGDSFAFGVVPYQYNYLTLLEDTLQKRLGNVTVFNMGISNTNPQNYHALLLDEGIKLKPDMILLSFFIGNDFETPRRPRYTYSYIATLINYILTIQEKLKDAPSAMGAYCDTCASFPRADYLKIERNRAEFFTDYDKSIGFKDHAQPNLKAISQIDNYCRQNNIPFVVAILPDEIQVDSTLQDEIVEAYYPTLKRLPYDVTSPTELLTGYLQENNIKYINLLPIFRTETRKGSLYKPNDSHWNIAGNQLSSSVLADSLEKIITASKTK